MDYRAEVRNFVKKNLEAGDVTFTDQDNYFAKRFVNSLFAMRLVNFIESLVGCEIDSDDLSLENFSSIDQVVSLIKKIKQSSVV